MISFKIAYLVRNYFIDDDLILTNWTFLENPSKEDLDEWVEVKKIAYSEVVDE